MSGFSRPSEAEISERDVNLFAGLTPEFFQAHAEEVVALNNDGELLSSGTMQEVQEYIRLTGDDGVHVVDLPGLSLVLKADLNNAFDLSDTEGEEDITDATRQAIDRMLFDE